MPTTLDQSTSRLAVLHLEPNGETSALAGEPDLSPGLRAVLRELGAQAHARGAPVEAMVPDGDRELHVTILPAGEPRMPGDPGRAIAILAPVDSDVWSQQGMLEAEKHQSLCRLVSGMVHELRNPLASISLVAELLALRADVPDAVGEKLGDIVHHVERAEEVLQSLRRYGREEQSSMRAVSLNELVRDSVRLERSLASARGVDLVVDLDPDLPPVLADPSQLRVAIANLVRNGVEAIPEEELGRKVFVRTARRHGVIRVVVEDEGPGIPAEALRRIFEPHMTTKKSGTGLGLPIALGIVRSHGGHLWAENRRRRGARFLVDLPDPQHSTPARLESVLGIELTTGPTRSALVVDADEERLEQVRQAIATMGWKVHVATSAAVALRKLRASDFDALLVSDGEGGDAAVDLCARSRLAHPELSARLVVMLPDEPGREIADRLRLVGARVTIGRPDDIDFPRLLDSLPAAGG